MYVSACVFVCVCVDQEHLSSVFLHLLDEAKSLTLQRMRLVHNLFAELLTYAEEPAPQALAVRSQLAADANGVGLIASRAVLVRLQQQRRRTTSSRLVGC